MVTEADQERVWFAREVMQLFIKCFTTLKLYPHDHMHCVEALDAFAKRLRGYVKLHDVLRLKVDQESLRVEDQPVYEATNRKENLAFRLYVDGLREVSIQRGVTRDEARKLAQVFYQAVVDPTLDATILLWEADLIHIEYLAINSLSEAWEAPDYLTKESLDLLADMNRDVDWLVNRLSAPPGSRSADFELSDGATEVERSAALLGEDLDAHARKDGANVFEIDPDALTEFASDVRAWGPDRLLHAVVSSSLDGMTLVPSAVGVDNVRWVLKEAMEMALRTEDLTLLRDLLQRYAGELELTEDPGEEEILEEALEWIRQPEHVQRLAAAARGPAGGGKAFVQILALLGPTGTRAAVTTLAHNPPKELRESLLKFLQGTLGRDPRPLAPLFEPGRTSEVIRDGLFLLSKLRDPDPKHLEASLQAARAGASEDAELQAYVDHMWRTLTVAGRLQSSVEALAAEQEPERLRALRTLLDAEFAPALDTLRQIVASSEFLQRSPKERQAFLHAVLRLGGSKVVAFLQQQAQRGGGVFHRKAAKEVRAVAAECLEQLKRGRG